MRPPRLITDEEAAEIERREAESDLRTRIARTGIPHRYRMATLATCRPEAVEYARAVVEGEGVNLILTGQAGSGKTYTACAVARGILGRRRMSARFATMTDILSDVKRAYGSAEREDQVIDHYANAGLLVIDDLGKERASQWSLPLIWQIVNRRYNAVRPTIYTTQYGDQALAARFAEGGGDGEYAQALMRRITDDRRAVTLRLARTYA
ncbi:MAG: ATP-binding protein [Eggerthellaceae bacterium]|nr:ATP-binding protein [Eggerthellaceae bacterium]